MHKELKVCPRTGSQILGLVHKDDVVGAQRGFAQLEELEVAVMRHLHPLVPQVPHAIPVLRGIVSIALQKWKRHHGS